MVALLLISLAVLLAGVAGSVLLMVRTGETRIGILLACFTLLAARQAFALWANGDASLALDANTAGELAVLAASGVGLMVLTGLRRTLDERDRAETLHWDSMEAVRRLGELSAQTGLSLDERFETLLKIGCQCFALETGMISRVHKQRFEVIAIHAAEDFPVSRGAVFLLADTHCSATLESDRPVAFERIGDSARPGSSERAAFGFGAYLGAAIRVSGEVVGTISFGSRQPRAQRFTATDKDLLRLLAHWIGTELERRFASEEREASAAKAAAVTAAPPTRARRFESPGARTVDVNSAIERATGKLRALAGVDVDCRLADDLLPIAKPRISIGTLAESLAKVAVSAASGHGRLTLTTANLEVATSDPNVIPAVAPNRYVTFSVEITDPGIDAECLEQAFGSQADAPSLASGAITAEPLPLASIYRALQRGGGDLSLEVEAGASATLTAFLPCASADADTSTGPRLASGRGCVPAGLGGTRTVSRPSGFTAAWFCLGVCATVACASPPHQDNPGADTVTGVIYHDRNGDGVRDRFDFGIRGVAVSNGVDVVRTDWRGHYRLPISDDTIVFVVKPGGYATPLGEHQLPRFHYIHKPAGSPQDLRFPGVEPTGPLPASVDFPLTRQRERDRFDVLVFGDTQPYSLAEIDLLAHDVIEELIGSDAAFGITLGDIVGDDLALFEPLSAAVARVGIPWHNVPGNHDMNYRAESDITADETFERFYGPGTYAFEYGSAHFVVLDDVIYGGAGPEGGSSQNYSGGLSEDQLTFVGNYLSGVPRSHLVVIAMHIPLEGPTPTLDLAQRPELLALLANHPHNLSIAAHTHTQGHQFFGAESGYAGPGMHHHLIQGTTSGSWWLGATDEQGIPHAMMRDGTPNGYSILHVDGNEYAVRYKVARRPADHQMNVFLPDVIDASDPEPVEVLVNVFSGSERSSVEMRVGDSEPWSPLVRVERRAPYFVELKRREAAAGKRPERPLPPADPSTHVWQGTLRRGLPTGTHTLHVRTTDMFGQTFHANRILRVE